MLPRVNAQQGNQVARDRILICAGDESQRAALLVLGQPRPATALDSSQRSVGLLLEGGEGSEVALDSFLNRQRTSVSQYFTP